MTLDVVVRARIHAGKTEEFKQVATELLAIVQAKDPDTLRWDWYVSEDGTECVVLESYGDSNGLLAHLANLGPGLGRLFALADTEIVVLGEMSEQLKAAVAGIPHRNFPTFLTLAPAETV